MGLTRTHLAEGVPTADQDRPLPPTRRGAVAELPERFQPQQ
jgi:hypothetical protein